MEERAQPEAQAAAVQERPEEVLRRGSLGLIVDMCNRKEWLQITAPQTYFEGQRLLVESKDWTVSRGSLVVMAVSVKYSRIYVDHLPAGIMSGDHLFYYPRHDLR